MKMTWLGLLLQLRQVGERIGNDPNERANLNLCIDFRDVTSRTSGRSRNWRACR